MLKRSSGVRRLPFLPENNNVAPINIYSSGNNINPNSVVVSAAPSAAPSPVITRSVSPALTARSVRRVTLNKPIKYTANVQNTAQALHAAAFGKQKLETLRVNRRRAQRRTRSSRKSRNSRSLRN